MQEQYMKVDDVMKILHVSDGKAYSIIRQLNSELKQKGFIVVAGRVPRKYFNERFYIEQ